MKLSEKGIIIRKTVEADLPQIYAEGEIEPLLLNLPFRFNAENLADSFASYSSICFSAVRKKKILGFIIGSAEGDVSTVSWMIVKDKFRRAGIGKELLERFIDESKKASAEKFSVAVFRNSADSVKFFTDNGFSVEKNFVELSLKLLSN